MCLLLAYNAAFSQGNPTDKPKSTNPAPFIVEKVAIVDASKIVFDLYTMVSGDLADYINKQAPIDGNVVIFSAIPKTWQGKMKEAKDKAHWPTIQKYNAWRIAASPTYDVLEIRASENTSMPEGFIPTKNFYIVIEPSGVRKVTEQTPVNNMAPNCALVHTMYYAVKNKFADIKGKSIPSADFGNRFEAKVAKGEYEKVYIKEFLSMYELIAEFGTFTSHSKATERFFSLLQNFRSCKDLELKKETDKENAYNIVTTGGFVVPQVTFKMEKEKDEYKISLSIHGY
jgi:hypothetical protein